MMKRSISTDNIKVFFFVEGKTAILSMVGNINAPAALADSIDAITGVNVTEIKRTDDEYVGMYLKTSLSESELLENISEIISNYYESDVRVSGGF